jgi:hypothetical protein
MALLELIESRVFGSHGMAHRRRLMNVLRDQTAFPLGPHEELANDLGPGGLAAEPEAIEVPMNQHCRPGEHRAAESYGYDTLGQYHQGIKDGSRGRGE